MPGVPGPARRGRAARDRGRRGDARRRPRGGCGARPCRPGLGPAPPAVAAGGDGTVSAVASHLLGSDRTLGILPLGTFNYVAREFGIPLTVEDAIRVIAGGTERIVDVGEVNGRAFLNNAGLGGYVKIVRRRERVFRSWGRSR
ncbi:MAG: diacylglycerol kinase family lipid kinase, partial [Deltaproteobacteria bacterium]|nr:diacylglycerol kinase family lipid kinase [Deltaproteobacteria bacterium]